MALLIRLIPLALLIALIVWGVRQMTGTKRSKCQTCRHCRKAFDDGTLCTFGNRETFKNTVHVQNCVDHEPRSRKVRSA